jgi:hypothetical protein
MLELEVKRLLWLFLGSLGSELEFLYGYGEMPRNGDVAEWLKAAVC